MTVTERNIGIQGRLAREPRFVPATETKKAMAYARILNDVSTFVGDDANGKPQFSKETVGYELALEGELAEAFNLSYTTGDKVLVIANKDEWTRNVDGKEFDNVTYHVKAVGEALVARKVLAGTPSTADSPTTTAVAVATQSTSTETVNEYVRDSAENAVNEVFAPNYGGAQHPSADLGRSMRP